MLDRDHRAAAGSIRSTIRTWLLGVAAAACAASPPAALAQPCGILPKERTNAAYVPDAAGEYYRIYNWLNDSAAPTEPLEADENDYHNFTYCASSLDPTQYIVGPHIRLADPTVLQINEWFYITGTNGEDFFRPPSSSAPTDINFLIYRTKDFANFELHMMAFAPNDIGVASEQYIAWGPDQATLHLNNGKWFTRLWAPHLYMDPTQGGSDPFVYLTFSAVEKGFEDGDHSIFHVRIRRSKFLEWHNKDPLLDDGIRFADQRAGLGWQAWFCYRLPDANGNLRSYFDGGVAAGANLLIPNTATIDMLGTLCGVPGYTTLQRKYYDDPPSCDPPTNPRGFEHNEATCPNIQAAILTIDPFVFIDPKLPDNHPWKRVLIYNWDGRKGCRNDEWGNHIAAMPLGSTQFYFVETESAIPLAAAKNRSNRNFAKDAAGHWQWVDNGAMTGSGYRWGWGGVAEGATAFYLPETDRYYLVYSRNTTDSAAYQIVYRMTEPGEPFSSLALSSWNDMDAPEHMLLRATDLTDPTGWSFGHPQYFEVIDCNNVVHPYLAFFAKLEGSTQRTVMFKELTVEPDGSGRLKQLYEVNFDPSRDIRFFRMPLCIKSRTTGLIGGDPGGEVDPGGPGGIGGGGVGGHSSNGDEAPDHP